MLEKETFTPIETDRKIIALKDIMDPNRSIPENYKKLILAQEKYQRTSSATSFSWRWGDIETGKPSNDTLERLFKEHLNQQVLVDLGGGQIDFSYMYSLAKHCGASAYINVDLQRHGGEINPFQPQDEKITDGFYEAKVAADMLDFVAHMKDGSANFAINGIDQTIIDDPEYNEVLAQELVRATARGGIIFGIESDVGACLGGIARKENAPIRPVLEAIERISGNFSFNKFLFEKLE